MDDDYPICPEFMDGSGKRVYCTENFKMNWDEASTWVILDYQTGGSFLELTYSFSNKMLPPKQAAWKLNVISSDNSNKLQTIRPQVNITCAGPLGCQPTAAPSNTPHIPPTVAPVVSEPSVSPTTSYPTETPTVSPTPQPTSQPSLPPVSSRPSVTPVSSRPTQAPSCVGDRICPALIVTNASVYNGFYTRVGPKTYRSNVRALLGNMFNWAFSGDTDGNSIFILMNEEQRQSHNPPSIADWTRSFQDENKLPQIQTMLDLEIKCVEILADGTGLIYDEFPPCAEPFTWAPTSMPTDKPSVTPEPGCEWEEFKRCPFSLDIEFLLSFATKTQEECAEECYKYPDTEVACCEWSASLNQCSIVRAAVSGSTSDSRDQGNFVTAPDRCVRPPTSAAPTITVTSLPTKVRVIETSTSPDGKYTVEVVSRGGRCLGDRMLVALQVEDFGECAELVSGQNNCSAYFTFYQSAGECYCQRAMSTNENCISRDSLSHGVYQLGTMSGHTLHDSRVSCEGDRMHLEMQIQNVDECAELARANTDCSAYFSFSGSAMTCTCQRSVSTNSACTTTRGSTHGVFRLL